MSDCLFCKIARGEITSDFLYETDQVFVIRDIHPKTKVHLLAIPKQHVVTLNDITVENTTIVAELALAVAAVTKRENIAEAGYKVVVNNGPASGQEVPHLHWHILGGQPIKGLV